MTSRRPQPSNAQFSRLPALLILAILTGAHLAASVKGIAQTIIHLDFDKRLNQVEGFGFSAAFGPAADLKALPAAQQREILDLLFSRQSGAGFSILRLGINTDGTIEPQNPGLPSAKPRYIFDGSDGGQLWLAQQAQRYGVTNFTADAWTAPVFMKTSPRVDGGDLCGVVGATCVTGDWRSAYTQHLLQYVRFYRESGVRIRSLGFANEPDIPVSYASMAFTPKQAIDLLSVFGPEVRASGLGLSILCCDASTWVAAETFTSAIEADPASAYVDIVSAHQYGSHAVKPLPTRKPVWMTEWSSGLLTFNPRWDCGNCVGGPDGMYLAHDIVQALARGSVNAYLCWWAPGSGPATLIQISTNNYTIAKRFYAIAAISRFIRPGAFRIDVGLFEADMDGVAFRNPSGSRVLVLLNSARIPKHLDFDLGAVSADSDVQTFLTDTTHSIAETDTARLSQGKLTVDLPPRSLTSITLPPPTIAGTASLTTVTTLERLSDGSYQAATFVKNSGTGTADDVRLVQTKLGRASGEPAASSLPESLGSISPGGSVAVSINFPENAGRAGKRVIETYTGSYAGGKFASSERVLLP